MDGIIFLLIGVVIGVVMLIIVSCAAVNYDKTTHDNSHEKQHDQLCETQKLSEVHKLSHVLFATFIYCMSDNVDKETIITYMINAIKICINKGSVELTKDDMQIHDCAKYIYESIMSNFERGDV